jgi:uncharacterized phage infection (PIP) family protein YhgE
MNPSAQANEINKLESDALMTQSSDSSTIQEVINNLRLIINRYQDDLSNLDQANLYCPNTRQALKDLIDEAWDRIHMINLQDWHDQVMAEVDRQLLKCPQYSWLSQCDE